MMTDEEVRALIVCRLAPEGGAYFENHRDGQLRALLSVLTGEPPPKIESIDGVPKVLDVAGVPYIRDGDRVRFHPQWLKAHGFDVDGPDPLHHPRWSKPW